MSKNKTVLSFIVFLSCCFFFSFANALSLGDIKAGSSVGEKLNAFIEVDSRKSFNASQVLVSVAPRTVYDRLGVYWEYSHSSLNFEVSQVDSKNGLIKVTSSEVIYEPYLEFVVSVRWPEGLLTKSYTLLLDMEPVRTGGGISAPVETAPSDDVSSPVEDSTPIKAKTAEPAVEKKIKTEPKPAAKPSPTAGSPASTSQTQPADESFKTSQPVVAEPVDSAEKSWRIQAQYGDTLWSIAKQVEAESGVDVWNVMAALYEHNPNAFGASAHDLLAKATLSVTQAQLDEAPRLSLAPREAVPAQDLSAADEPAKSRRESRSDSDAKGQSAEQVASAEAQVQEEKKLLSVVADGPADSASLDDDTTAGSSPLSGNAAPVVGEVDRGELEQVDEEIDQSLGEARQRVEDIESRLDVLIKQYEELNQKTEDLKELEQELNRRIAERTLQGIDAPPATSEVQPAAASSSPREEFSAENFFTRYGWLILALALALLVALLWLVFTRPDRMVPVAEQPAASPATAPGSAPRTEGDAGSDLPREDWDDTAFLESKRFSDEELAEMVKLKGEKAYVESQGKEKPEPVDYSVSDGAVELQVAMYIAYERYDEAEEMINASLLKKPDNTPLKLQLLEIFAARGDREQFDQLAGKLADLEDPDVNATISSLGDF